MSALRIDRFLALQLVRPLQHMGLAKARPGIPILMYHSVSEEDEPGVSPYYRLVTPPDVFALHMQLLREAGYSTIDLPDAIRRVRQEEGLPERCVVITFDDGFQDFHTHAWPTLEQFNFTATVFLPSAFIGSTAPKSFKGRKCLTWGEARDLQSAGVRFGSHTDSHPVLHDLAWPDILAELRDSKHRIEDQLHMDVVDFAYPFAYPQADDAFCSRFRDSLRDTGYTSCVTTRIGRFQVGDDAFSLARLPVNGADDPGLFKAKLAGEYDVLGPVQAGFKNLKTRVRGRTRDRVTTPVETE